LIIIEIPNESLYLGIEHDSFVILNPCGKGKSYLYNWSRNWWFIVKLRLIHLRN